MQQPQISPFLRDTIFLLAAKRTMLRKEKDNIDTLVIGSSHGDFGFNPAHYPKSFNLCFRSQDLKHSFHLFERLSTTYPNIRNLVLFYSVFSSGSFMEKSSSEKVISPPMSEIFELNLQYEDEELKSIAETIKGELSEISIDIEGVRGFFPESAKGFMPDDYTVERRASDHMKLNRVTDANMYLNRMLDLASKQGQRVCIVIPPVRTDYKQAVGAKSDILFKSLFDLLKDRSQDEKISVLNFYDDPRFLDHHFGDYDHLHPLGQGTEMLTKSVLAKIGGQPANLLAGAVKINYSSSFPVSGQFAPFRINSSYK